MARSWLLAAARCKAVVPRNVWHGRGASPPDREETDVMVGVVALMVSIPNSIVHVKLNQGPLDIDLHCYIVYTFV